MIGLRAELQGGPQVVNGLRQANQSIQTGLRRSMPRIAKGGEGIVKGKASGRPGPRVVTGDFRRSIVGQFVGVSGDTYIVQIGSNAPQAARLEYGFSGPDVLGRVYNQPPFPYLAPSGPAILDLAVREIEAVLQAAVGRAG